MTFRPSMRGAVLVAAILCMPALALAQSSGTPAATAAAPAAMAPPSGAERAAEARVEARIKELHAELHITSAQAAPWNEFAAIMRDNARAMDAAAEQRAAQLPTMNAVDDLKSYEGLAEQHVDRLQRLIPAFVALYDSMSPHQKAIADRLFRGRAERHAHRG